MKLPDDPPDAALWTVEAVGTGFIWWTTELPDGCYIYRFDIWRGDHWEPVYVGKTESEGLKRPRRHVPDALYRYARKFAWHRALKAYLERGAVLRLCVEVAPCLVLLNACEIAAIAGYGRRDRGTGTLWNSSDGGDGFSSGDAKAIHAAIASEPTRAARRAEKLSAANAAITADPIRAAQRSEYNRRNAIAGNSAIAADPERAAQRAGKLVIAAAAIAADPVRSAKRHEVQRRIWLNHEVARRRQTPRNTLVNDIRFKAFRPALEALGISPAILSRKQAITQRVKLNDAGPGATLHRFGLTFENVPSDWNAVVADADRRAAFVAQFRAKLEAGEITDDGGRIEAAREGT